MCCGHTFRTKARNVAIFQIIINILIFVALLVNLILVNVGFETSQIAAQATILFIIMMGCTLIALGLAIILLIGVRKESMIKCWIWLIGNAIFLAAEILVTVAHLIFTQNVSLIISGIISICITWYFLYIVNSYIYEFREIKDRSSGTVLSNSLVRTLNYSA